MTPSESVFQTVHEAGLRPPNAWLAVVAAPPNFETALEELGLEAQAQLDQPLRVVNAADLSVDQVGDDLCKTDQDWVALVGLDDWPEERWRQADMNRNTWERSGLLILCLGPKGADALGRFAPNLRSYIGGFRVVSPEQAGMSAEEVERRLAELRAHYLFTDHAVIEKAQQGTLPPDAHFVEWLILLDRGDLV